MTEYLVHLLTEIPKHMEDTSLDLTPSFCKLDETSKVEAALNLTARKAVLRRFHWCAFLKTNFSIK